MPRIDKSISRVLDSGKVEEVDYPLICRAGNIGFWQDRPIFSTGAPNKTLSLLVRDITQRKIDEENNRLRLAELELATKAAWNSLKGLSRSRSPKES